MAARDNMDHELKEFIKQLTDAVGDVAERLIETTQIDPLLQEPATALQTVLDYIAAQPALAGYRVEGFMRACGIQIGDSKGLVKCLRELSIPGKRGTVHRKLLDKVRGKTTAARKNVSLGREFENLQLDCSRVNQRANHIHQTILAERFQAFSDGHDSMVQSCINKLQEAIDRLREIQTQADNTDGLYVHSPETGDGDDSNFGSPGSSPGYDDSMFGHQDEMGGYGGNQNMGGGFYQDGNQYYQSGGYFGYQQSGTVKEKCVDQVELKDEAGKESLTALVQDSSEDDKESEVSALDDEDERYGELVEFEAIQYSTSAFTNSDLQSKKSETDGIEDIVAALKETVLGSDTSEFVPIGYTVKGTQDKHGLGVKDLSKADLKKESDDRKLERQTPV